MLPYYNTSGIKQSFILPQQNKFGGFSRKIIFSIHLSQLCCVFPDETSSCSALLLQAPGESNHLLRHPLLLVLVLSQDRVQVTPTNSKTLEQQFTFS